MFFRKDGEILFFGLEIVSVEGVVFLFFIGECVVFNFLGYFLGIVLMMKFIVDVVFYMSVKICCIWKIMLGLCVLEKYVVWVGGGVNYWFGFYDGIFIKDNYIVIVGGVWLVIEFVFIVNIYMIKIEVEVDMFE